MTTVRIALANLSFPESPDDSVKLAKQAIIDAAEQGAAIICFPECYVPGYRAPGRSVPPPDGAFLKQAWQSIAQAAGKANIAVVLGTERTTNDQGDDLPLPRPAALIINNDGSIAGFQEKVQIPPEEDGVYCAGAERYVFACGPLKFGVVICHEGWRYPETVRFAARRGAHLVFHPHFHEPETGGYVPLRLPILTTLSMKRQYCAGLLRTLVFLRRSIAQLKIRPQPPPWPIRTEPCFATSLTAKKEYFWLTSS